jgi:alpha-L-fucosidase 2
MRYLPLILIVTLGGAPSLLAQNSSTIWYKQPARNWNEALPIGNGRLGAMIFGEPAEELIQLNEQTLWSGGPANLNPNPQSPQHLQPLRDALAKEDYELADQLSRKMQGLYTESYMPMGDLVIQQRLRGAMTSYRRSLDVSNAVALTEFSSGGVTYSREMFSSAADQVMAIRIRSSRNGAVNFKVTLKSILRFTNSVVAPNEMAMRGKAPSYAHPNYVRDKKDPVVYTDSLECRGARFETRIKVLTETGKVSSDTSGISVEGATEVVIILAAATSFNGFDVCPDKDGKDEHALVQQYMDAVMNKDYGSMKKDHIDDYQKLFNRMELDLKWTNYSSTPTDERLFKYARGLKDNQLEALYFQFGRYLLISSSRPGGLPANLQGIWNHHLRPPWSSNYTININTEMNYWPAEQCNLSELHQPLIDHIKRVASTGRETAKNFYGLDGWTAHHNTDVWATSNPVGDVGKGDPMWATWAMGGAWLSQHLWEHYNFTRDTAYLRSIYPILKEAAVFCNQWLVEDGRGRLVTSPSTSPENQFITATGFKGAVALASTMDIALVRELFGNTSAAARTLHIDHEFSKTLMSRRNNLPPFQVGSKGQLMEWSKDFVEVDPQHRHVSHLYALHPGNQISPGITPELADAARQTLTIRGDGGTGWSKAWKINFWARLLDSDHAYKLLRELLRVTGVEGTDYANGGGTYLNLLCAHPPFQIDGNFGGTAGIAEMLLQSHLGEVHLLAALPTQWSREGSVKGLVARGAFTVDINWVNGKIVECKITSGMGEELVLRTPNKVRIKELKTESVQDGQGWFLRVPTVAGKTYTIKARG